MLVVAVIGLSLDACVELREKGKLKTVEDKKKKGNMRSGNSSGDHTPKVCVCVCVCVQSGSVTSTLQYFV